MVSFIRSLCLVLLVIPASLFGEPRTVRVGVFEAPPLVFVRNGVPQGLFIDLVKEFARSSGWTLKYVQNSWGNQLKALENREIDLLPAIGFTQDRESIYDFSKEAVFIDSGVLFVDNKTTLHTLFDLNGKRVAALKDSIFTKAFMADIAMFGIHCELVGTKDNVEVMEALTAGKVDAGVTIYSLGNYLARDFPVSITPITFSPIALEFAVPHGTNADLIQVIDRRMAEMKGDPGSVYSRSYSLWTMPPGRQGIPGWVWWSAAGLVIVGLFLGAWSFFLRREVAAQTRFLNAEKERWAVTLRSIADGVIITDTAGRVQFLNPAAQNLCGRGAGLWAGCPLGEVFRIERRGAGTFLLVPGVPDREITESQAPIIDSEGRNLGAVVVFQDITEKQKTSEVLQRTGKLESLGLLAGGIAHDFNNLLAGVFGYVALAKGAAQGNPGVIGYLDKALSVVDRAKGLSRQLLTFSSGGAPSMKIGSLEPLIRSSVAFAGAGSNVRCDVEVAPALRLCDFDQDQLGQVLDNLIINSRQAMPNGGRLVVSADNLDLGSGAVPGLAAGPYVRISVVDEGVGIPLAVQGRIFDPFFTTKSTGHGLGLATCNSIVLKHHGAMDFETTPGHGTKFRIYLPSANRSSAPAEAAQTPIHHGRGTIVVMDDEAFIREILGEELKSMGYEVCAVADGEAVLECLSARVPPVPVAVLLDLTVPGAKGGRDIAPVLNTWFPNMPVIAVSGFSDDPVLSRPGAYGFRGSLKKPFSKEELEAVLVGTLG